MATSPTTLSGANAAEASLVIKETRKKDKSSYRSSGFGEPWAWAFLAPALLLFIVFEYYPFIRAVILSTQATDLFGRPTGFAGFSNYTNLLSSPDFWRVFTWTLTFTVVSVVLKLGVGLSIALPLSYRLRGTWFMRSAVLIPMAVSTAVGTLVFGQIFKPFVGVADRIAQVFGLQSLNWLTDATMAKVAVIIVDTWAGVSFVTLLLMAAIDGVSKDIIEAAQLDGCTGFRSVIHMVLPSISPMIMFLVLTQSAAALREFTIIDVLTDGGPSGATTTLVVDVYNLAFGNSTNDFSGAAANGMVLFVIILILSLIQLRMGQKKVTY